MRIYLAARYARMEEIRGYGEQLEAAGHIVTSQWIKGKEEGGKGAKAAAQMDIDDVLNAEAIIFFGEPRGSANRGGGRWFEFGLAFASGHRLIAVLDMSGDATHDHNEPGHESVFTHLDEVEKFTSFHELLEVLS